jgi:enoyl-CoA hydratase
MVQPTPSSDLSSTRDRVLVECRGAVRILTLNRPDKLNAADLDMQRRLVKCWQELRHADDTRAVVLAGAGRAFCAGGDVEILRQIDTNGELRAELGRIHRELVRIMLTLPMPIVGAVHGPAVGFGAELAALCDLVVIGRDAYLSDPHVQQGLPPSPGCQLVWPYLASRAAAKELLLTGRRIDGEEALRLGLVNRLTAPGEELSIALALAEELAALPPSGVVAAKAAFNRPVVEEAERLEEFVSW